MHYLTQCQNSIISRTRVELLEPFHKKWKGIHKLTLIELRYQVINAILACQNDDIHVIRNKTSMFKNPKSFVASFLYHTELVSIVFVFAVYKVHSLSIYRIVVKETE